MQFSSFFLL